MIINGSGQPRLIVTDSTHPVSSPLANVLLPFCEKIVEKFTQVYVKHKLYGGRTEAIGKGWDYSVKLDYSGVLDGSVLIAIEDAFRLVAETDHPATELILYPRSDSTLFYRVIFGAAIEQSIIKNGDVETGHEGIVFEFEGLDRLTRKPTVVPEVVVEPILS